MPQHHPHTSNPLTERGQTLAEYAVLISGIAVVVAVSIPLLGTAILRLFAAAASALGG